MLIYFNTDTQYAQLSEKSPLSNQKTTLKQQINEKFSIFQAPNKLQKLNPNKMSPFLSFFIILTI